ncbi:hypothetical protein EHF33_14500 [Deinococcus psychrotolerans]|uniref:Uncharacterized protein n=1 Tax=Deinococcus psychrotolerans TaxID=2489213 RepID=A0A3G8YFQ0_9DEIO|nr:hypothetical protein [Deinococcus psychrotolerans]AZI44118.1 hypothetical protein EHF33_14500 [Deinococcus psychrotolerans]
MTLTVIQADGSSAAPSEKDQQLLTLVQGLLAKDPHFQVSDKPILSRAEVNAGQQDTEAGYLYLRYDIPGKVPQEFWGHWGSRDHVAWKSGQISVKPQAGSLTR